MSTDLFRSIQHADSTKSRTTCNGCRSILRRNLLFRTNSKYIYLMELTRYINVLVVRKVV